MTLRHPTRQRVENRALPPEHVPSRPELLVRPPGKRSWLRRHWNDDRFVNLVGGFCIALLSLVVGVATFQIVSAAASSRDGDAAVTPAPGAGGAASGPGGTATSGGSGRAASRSRVPAAGELLAARAPLDQIKQDQGISVALPDGRTLWIFADTFQRSRSPNFFVTSAAATTEPGGRVLSYAVKAGGGAVEFLPRKPAEKRGSVRGEHYKAVWPVGATLLPDGRIIIAYAKYEVKLKTKQFEFLGSGLFSYRYTSAKALHHGAQATRIADDIWAPYDGEVRSPVYDGGYVYFTQCQELRCYALRTTPAGLGDRLSYRWWTGSSWSQERNARATIEIGSNHPGGNASVVRLDSGVFAMADTEVGAPSPYGYVWVAARPQGPWSRAASYPMPGCDPGGCYGLNLHPSLSTAGLLRLSYATTAGPVVRVTDIRVSIAKDGTSVSTSASNR